MDTEAVMRFVRRVPGMRRFQRTDLYKSIRHSYAVHFGERRDYKVTRFFRIPAQFRLLVGPVVEHVLAGRDDSPLRVLAVGCSRGHEPYSVASLLLARRPGLRFSIHASDIDEGLLREAREGRYAPEDVAGNPFMEPWFVEHTFVREGDRLVVRPEIAEHVRFERADLLDPTLSGQVGTGDIVYAQNIFLNMPRRAAAKAFANTCTLLRPRSALFIDGVDLDMRMRLTRAFGLTPLAASIEEIHEAARELRASMWPYSPNGLEPLSRARRDWVRRYATVFLRGA